jgi:acyl carrier protein
MDQRAQIRIFIEQMLKASGKTQALTDKQSLFISGMLDSISAVELISFLEKNYNLKMDASFSIHKIDSLSEVFKTVQLAEESSESLVQ